MPARHVLHLHAAERRQIGDHPIQVQQRIVELNASVAEAEVLPQLVEDAPRVDREAVADVRGDAPQLLERLAQARAGTLLEQRGRAARCSSVAGRHRMREGSPAAARARRVTRSSAGALRRRPRSHPRPPVARRRCATGAPSARRARRSARARTGCPRRGSADRRIAARAGSLIVGGASSDIGLTGPSVSTHVSLLPPPRCIETIGTSPLRRNARQTARHHGVRVACGGDVHRAARADAAPASGRATPGAVESGISSCPTNCSGFARISETSADRCSVLSVRPKIGCPLTGGNVRLMTMRSRCSSTNSQIVGIAAPARRHRRQQQLLAEQAATEPRQKPARAPAVSIAPEPSALAIVTLPARAASTSPATPSVESARSSSGSQ